MRKRKLYRLDKVIARRADCPLDLLVELSRSERLEVKEAVAQNPQCPPYLLEELSQNDHFFLKLAVAANPNCPPHVLQRLTESEFEELRQSIASNFNCPVKILEQLSRDQNQQVRLVVAKNPNCSTEIFERLSFDQDPNVILALLQNPNCPVQILNQIFDRMDKGEFDSNSYLNLWLRRLMAEHPNCSDTILKRLIHDNDKQVVETVLSRSDVSMSVIEEGLKATNKSIVEIWLNQNQNKKRLVRNLLQKDKCFDI